MNYNPQANVNNNLCVPFVYGCTNQDAFNYNAMQIPMMALIAKAYCLNPLAYNYNFAANTNDQSCVWLWWRRSIKFNPNVNTNDGSCIDKVFGYLNPLAENWNPDANTNDNSCIVIIRGCTDPDALNYNLNATVDNGSCIQLVPGCINPFASNWRTG